MLDADVVVLHLARQLESLGEQSFQANGDPGALVGARNAWQFFYLGFHFAANSVAVYFGEFQHPLSQSFLVGEESGEKMQNSGLRIVAGQSLIPRLHESRLDLFSHFLDVHIFSSSN